MSWVGKDTSRVAYQQRSNQEIECYGLLPGQGFWVNVVEQVLRREGQEGYQTKDSWNGQMAIGVHNNDGSRWGCSMDRMAAVDGGQVFCRAVLILIRG